MPEAPHPASVAAAFRRAFGRPARLFRAPGRINLVGEHTDYNDGYVMPMNTAVHTWVAIAPCADRRIRARSVLFGETVDIDLDAPVDTGLGGWTAYVEGVLRILQASGFELSGADLLIDGNVPLGGGLSSSASLELAVAQALLGIAGHEVEAGRVARMCQRAEHEYVGVQCGIMDQFVIAAGAYNHAMNLDCRTLAYRQVALPATLRVLVTDSGVKHELAGGEYNRRRADCQAAARLMAAVDPRVTALRDVSAEFLERGRARLGEKLYRRARHVVHENQRVRDAEAAIVRGDLAALGRIIDASHDSLRDDYAVSCAELDLLVDIARRCTGVFGARMVGGGFGGCTITLIAADHLEQVRAAIGREYADRTGQAPWQHVVEPAHPAGEIET